MLGAFLIAVLFFIALPKSALISMDTTEDLSHLALNLQKEIPNAFNLGIRQGDRLAVVKNFSWFVHRVADNRDIAFTAMIGFGNNISTADYNVTVWNYYGSNQTVNVTIGTTMTQLFVAYNDSNSTSFSGTGALFNISFKYGSAERNMTWVRDKSSIYGYVKLVKRNNTIIRELEG
jgi:hypothetical protein